MNRELSEAIIFQISTELQAERRRSGLRLDDLADDTGVSRASLSIYLNRKRAMPMHVFLCACHALDVEPAVIIARATTAVSPPDLPTAHE